MEQRPTAVTLGVADLQRARRFYEKGLGWSASLTGNKDVVFFQANGLVIALWGRANLAKDANLIDDSGGFSGIALAHNARSREEVDAVLAKAGHAGARILKPGQDTFWGGMPATSPIPTAICGKSPGIRSGRSMTPAMSNCRNRSNQ